MKKEALNAKPFKKFVGTYTELQQQIHNDLRSQHPEWVKPNGECPTCDSYEARLIEELATFEQEGQRNNNASE